MQIQEKIEEIFGDAYALLDSGGFEKLEKFSNKTILRPSSLCLWKKSLSPDDWKNADAVFDPKEGWQFKGHKFTDWILPCRGFKLKLRLQTNGQVGIFPEHAYYLSHLSEFITDKSQPSKALNLFAYSGMASIFLLSKGVEVCHVDSSKKALDWAKENAGLNGIEEGKLRLIADDALGFLKRENRRNNKYDIVILDPPSFSRLDGKKTWKLEEVLYEFTENAAGLLNSGGMLVFSCHHSALDSRILSNVFQESSLKVIASEDLGLKESASGKILPTGSGIISLKI
jgi:23S rRNA (cytosine1962-C5)-methyltransferase